MNVSIEMIYTNFTWQNCDIKAISHLVREMLATLYCEVWNMF